MITTTLGGSDVTIHHGEAVHPPAGMLGLDVESTYMTDKGQWDPDFRVRTVQFATTDEAWVFDISNKAERTMAEACLTDDRVTFCSHTDMDVMAVWAEFGIDISARNVDTRMLAIQADPDNKADRDLKTLATAHGMPELEQAEKAKDARFLELWVEQGGKRNAKKADVQAHGWNTIDVSEEPFVVYAALDAVACRRLVELLTPKTQAPPEVLRTDQWLHVRANRLRMAGKRVDVDVLQSMLAEATQVTGEAKSKAMDLTGGVNIGGPKIQPWLAEHGADWSKWEEMGGAFTDTGAPSLSKDNVKILYDFDLDDVARQVVDEMVAFKGHQDLWNKCRGVDRVLDPDGRMHPLLNPIGATTTARMSSSGPNMQNFSKKDPRMRGIVLPDPGYVLVTADFAQVELRVVAALAREEKMIETILAGGDLHDLTVDLLAERGIEITRDIAKMTNFLIVYGGGAKALHEQGGIPVDVAQDVIRGFREQYTSITALAQYLGLEKEALRTASNRRLPVTRVKGSGERAGEIRSYANVNYAVQSASRELLVSSWRRLEVGHNRPGIVWWPVHDELVLQVPEDEVDAVIADVEDSMTFEFRGVPIEADAVVLRDEHGVSRWMTGKLAEKIAKEKETAA